MLLIIYKLLFAIYFVTLSSFPSLDDKSIMCWQEKFDQMLVKVLAVQSGNVKIIVLRRCVHFTFTYHTTLQSHAPFPS